ncbi:MAG: hypothetical protein ABEI52_02235, partial [Halobacteriaceae archaeon]
PIERMSSAVSNASIVGMFIVPIEMEFQQKLGVAIIVIPTLVAIFWFPLSQYSIHLWILAIIMIGGDAITTSLFAYFDEEEQKGVTCTLCGTQPSLSCMLFTRLPIVNSAALIYLAWSESEFSISYEMGTLPPELIPLMLAIGGAFAIVWNGYGFITPNRN